MSEPMQTDAFFATLAKVLLRCWVFGYVLMLVTLGVVVWGSDTLYRLNGAWFGLSKHELDLIVYGSMVLLKLQVIVLFFIPWLSVHLVSRRRAK